MLHHLLRLFFGNRVTRRLTHYGFLIFFAAVWWYGAAGYLYFEYPQNPKLTWSDANWWSIVTMTTVGYGDHAPATLGGRFLIGVPVMFLGIGLLGYLLSSLAATIMESKMKGIKGMGTTAVSDHIIVCRYAGLGALIKLLNELGADPTTTDCPVVLIDDHLEELPEELQLRGIHFIKGSPYWRQTWERANSRAARTIIIQADSQAPERSDNENLKIALCIQDYSPKVYSVVECLSPENEVFFKRAQCDSVVCLASLTSQMIVQEIQDPGVESIVSELTNNQHGKQIYLVPVPSGVRYYQELPSHFEQGTAIFGIRRGAKNFLLPGGDFSLEPGDRIVVVALTRPKIS